MNNVLLSAGEVSGDIMGAAIAGALRRRDPSAHLWGLGGARMKAAGVQVLRTTNHLGRVGVSESFSAVLPLMRAFADIRREVLRSRPQVAVLIANDVFNALLGRWLRHAGVPTVAVFPPQTWIWRSLLPMFARSYDAVAASFPDEVRLYGPHVRTVFAGHPLADALQPATDATRRQSRDRLGLQGRIVGLLPGSRAHEIRILAPMLVDAARRLSESAPDMRFVMAVADPEHRGVLAAVIQRFGLEKDVRLVDGSHDVLQSSDLLLLASGTATLEASLIGTPMVVLYRLSALTIFIVRTAIRLGLIDSETIALPNLLLHESIVPELRQETLTVDRIVAEAARLLGDPNAMTAMRENLARVRGTVDAGDSTSRIVDVIVENALQPLTSETTGMTPILVE